MTERIKELAIEAGIISAEYNGFDSTSRTTSQRKFAELIVGECIDWCNAHARDDGTAQRIAEDIKKDFGVEE